MASLHLTARQHRSHSLAIPQTPQITIKNIWLGMCGCMNWLVVMIYVFGVARWVVKGGWEGGAGGVICCREGSALGLKYRRRVARPMRLESRAGRLAGE